MHHELQMSETCLERFYKYKINRFCVSSPAKQFCEFFSQLKKNDYRFQSKYYPYLKNCLGVKRLTCRGDSSPGQIFYRPSEFTDHGKKIN